MSKRNKPVVWQRHHITYEPELVTWCTRAEHFYITRLSRFASLSRGAKRAIRFILREKPIRERTTEQGDKTELTTELPMRNGAGPGQGRERGKTVPVP